MSSRPLAYPTTTCSTLSVSTQNPTPGESITVTGSGFKPDSSVHLVLKPAAGNSSGKTYDLGTFTTDANGDFSTSITLPDSITNGGHFDIVATSGFVTSKSCDVDPFQAIDIQAATVTSTTPSNNSPGGTAFTGLDIAGLIAVGLVLIGAGALFTRRGRRTASRV